MAWPPLRPGFYWDKEPTPGTLSRRPSPPHTCGITPTPRLRDNSDTTHPHLRDSAAADIPPTDVLVRFSPRTVESVLEHTSDVLQVDDSYIARGPADWKWPPGRTDQWGAAAPKDESVKQAQLAILFAG